MNRLTGLSIPFRIRGGGLHMLSGEQKLAQNIRHMIETRIGERVMLRDYGSGLHSARDELNSKELVGLVRHELDRALRIYLAGVQVENSITVRAQDNRLQVVLQYRSPQKGQLEQLNIEF